MELVGGPLGVAAIGVAAVLVIALAVLHFRFHIFRRRKGRGRHRPGAPGAGSSRIEILESKTIDGDRKLVLVRCDDVEHLIVVGGPADVVVENDVRKVRGPSTSTPQRSPMMEPAKRAATAAWQSSSTMAEAPAAARPAESSRPTRPTPEPRSVTAAAPRAPSVTQPPLGQAGAGNASRPESAAQNRPPAQRSPADSAVARRDGQPPRRAAPNGPSPVSPRGTEPHRSPVASSERPTRQAARGATPSSGLPAAQIPWSDPDSIESEIVRALRFDPRIRPPGASAADGRRELSTAKSLVDSSTTLGDLADRLEEALAREVQSATPARSPEVNIQDFGFEPQAERPAIEQPLAPLEREDRREREPQKLAAKTVMAPAPEPEPRREASPPPERREETPVISLNSRRREAADPLEDEMARLLGELTSDTKGR